MTKRIGPHRSERIPAWAGQALRKPVQWSSQLWKAYLDKKNECRKHQLTVNIIKTSFELQMRVKIVREELLSWFNVSTRKGNQGSIR